MTKSEQIKQAIRAHFACDTQMKCDTKLEDSVDAAKAFLLHLTGSESRIFDSLIQTSRYQVKLQLIKRYINNLNEKKS